MRRAGGPRPRVIVTGGGSGGHLFPAVAVGEALVARGCAVRYVGSAHGLESRCAWPHPFERVLLPIRGLARGEPLRALRALAGYPAAFAAGRRAVAEFHPTVVAGFGGFASAPCLLAAASAGIPFILHESNAVPGLVNRRFARRAAALLAVDPDAATAAGWSGPRGVFRCGNPVRPAIAALARGRPRRSAARTAFGLPKGGRTLVIMPGSQGSRALNDRVREGLDELAAIPSLSLLWMTGEREYPSVEPAARDARLPCAVFPFFERVELAYAASDLFLGRAGSSTLAELACAGLPAVLVPLPSAAGDHQRANATAYAGSGAAQVMEQGELTRSSLADVVRECLRSERRTAMAAAARRRAEPEAAERIADRIEQAA